MPAGSSPIEAFRGIVDYAGLFPPASCSMADSARQYDVYRRSADRWMLGRFVVAAIRLNELASALHQQGIVIAPDDPWRLSVVLGNVVPDEIALIEAFSPIGIRSGLIIDSVECRAASTGQVEVLNQQIPARFRRFFEVPAHPPYSELLQSIGAVNAMAKIRTGGTKADLFPDSEELTTFLMASVRHRVPFKATAGLHHPFRGDYPLTYEADAQRHTMHGFVNLALALTELSRGGEGETAQAILDDRQGSFSMTGQGIRWRDEDYWYKDIAGVHEALFLSFGSCSFREPVDELAMAT